MKDSKMYVIHSVPFKITQLTKKLPFWQILTLDRLHKYTIFQLKFFYTFQDTSSESLDVDILYVQVF